MLGPRGALAAPRECHQRGRCGGEGGDREAEEYSEDKVKALRALVKSSAFNSDLFDRAQACYVGMPGAGGEAASVGFATYEVARPLGVAYP